MAQKHHYKNHEHVISVLTTKYGFTYTGIGDNAEECFFKDSRTPERIYVHSMHCSYDMSSSREIMAPRLHSVCFQSRSQRDQEQEKAFNQLLAHLDKVTVKQPERPLFTEVMEFNRVLWPLFREKFARGDFNREQAMQFLGVTHKEYQKIQALNV